MSIKIKTISTVQLPPPKCRKNLFHVVLTNKNRNFDTVGIKVAVLSFCLKALISRSFWLLRCLLLASRTIAHRQSSPQRYWMAVGYCLFF